MTPLPLTRVAYSRLFASNEVLVPSEVRNWLDLGAGDTLRYRLIPQGVLVDKASAAEADWLQSLQITLTEWSTPEDAAAYDDL